MRFTSFGGRSGSDGPSADELWQWSRRFSPPENELPAPAPFSLVVARTDSLALCLLGSHAYTTGFAFDLAVRFNQTPRRLGHRLFELISGLGPDGAAPKERLLLGVEYADGRTATNIGALGGPFGEPGSPRPDDELVLSPSGGGGGGRTYDQTYWVSPLPPQGPVTFVCSWEALGVAETAATVEGAVITSAAEDAMVLWEATPPRDDEDEGNAPDVPDGWFSRAARRRLE